ncbi:MAG: hypothetical protein QF864_12255 [SAR202 cluster bacterium]|nr:hypothetical protein [SAR202 cluster bacterium]
MSLFTKLVNMFTDSVEDTAKEMKQNQVDKFADDILSDPKAKAASERLKQAESDMLDTIKNKELLKDYVKIDGRWRKKK